MDRRSYDRSDCERPQLGVLHLKEPSYWTPVGLDHFVEMVVEKGVLADERLEYCRCLDRAQELPSDLRFSAFRKRRPELSARP